MGKKAKSKEVLDVEVENTKVLSEKELNQYMGDDHMDSIFGDDDEDDDDDFLAGIFDDDDEEDFFDDDNGVFDNVFTPVN